MFRPFVVWMLCAAAFAGEPRVLKHRTVYQESGRFGGWPANHGIWSWGNEIVVGFSAAYFQLKTPDRHQYDNTKPEEPRLARSLDGGETWSIEAPKSLLPPEQGGPPVRDLDKPMDFTHPDFAMTLRFTGVSSGPSRLWYSYDRGRSWNGPFAFPMFGAKGIAARTDYIVNGRRDALVFATAAKSDGREGRVFCARTRDGGLTWAFVSWIGEEPRGFSIMPSSVRLPGQVLLSATRVKQDQETSWIDLYRSGDDGGSWELLARPTETTGAFSGNPPSLLRLADGRLCLTYGTRSPPYGIRARLSRDDGRTWSDEALLRNDGAAWDIGYVRSAARPDGKVVTVYYFPPQPHKERIIAATLWDPGSK